MYTCKVTTAASSRKGKRMALRELRMRRLDLLKKMAPELRWEERGGGMGGKKRDEPSRKGKWHGHSLWRGGLEERGPGRILQQELREHDEQSQHLG